MPAAKIIVGGNYVTLCHSHTEKLGSVFGKVFGRTGAFSFSHQVMEGPALRRCFPSLIEYLVLSARQIKPATTFIYTYHIGIWETQIKQIAYMFFPGNDENTVLQEKTGKKF